MLLFFFEIDPAASVAILSHDLTIFSYFLMLAHISSPIFNCSALFIHIPACIGTFNDLKGADLPQMFLQNTSLQ